MLVVVAQALTEINMKAGVTPYYFKNDPYLMPNLLCASGPLHLSKVFRWTFLIFTLYTFKLLYRH